MQQPEAYKQDTLARTVLNRDLFLSFLYSENVTDPHHLKINGSFTPTIYKQGLW